MQKRMRIGAWVLLCLYGILMLWLLFGQRLGHTGYGSYWVQLKGNVNLIPFRTVQEYIAVVNVGQSPYLLKLAIINLAGNVVMFIPLGFLLPALWPKLRSFFRMFFYATGIIVCIEMVQLFTLLGSCDIDDLILNLLGASLGFFLFKASCRLWKAGQKRKQ